MATIRPIQPTFASGEVGPPIYSRVDIARYQSALRRCRNFIIHPTGGASNRPGTRFVAEAKYTENQCIVQEFVFNQEQKYVLEIGHEYIRFYTSGAQLNVDAADLDEFDTTVNYTAGDYVTFGGSTVYFALVDTVGDQPDLYPLTWAQQSIYEIFTPYQASDLSGLRFETSGDTIFITHPDYKPRLLQRFGETDWRLSEYEADDGPFMPENIDDTFTMNVSAVTGTSVQLGAGGDIFANGHVGALFKLRHYVQSQNVTAAYTGSGTGTPVSCFTTWRIITHGTWTGSFKIEKSTDGGSTWTTLRTFSSANDFNANTSGTEDIAANPVPFLIRINCTTLSSGTANIDLSSDAFYQEGIIRITSVTSTRIATGDMLQDAGSTSNTTSWFEGSWSDYRGWPAVSRFFQDRLVFAGTASEPMTMWMTQTSNYYSFFRHSTLLDTDGITARLPSRQLNAINGLVSFKRLLVFTSASIWSVGPVTGSAMTPTGFTQEVEAYNGSNGINPVVIGNEAIYIQEHGHIVSNIGYNEANQGFAGSDTNIMASHLFDKWEILDIAYQRNPDRIVWMLRDDGKLVGMTYLRDQEVVAFHWHDTGQASGDEFESLCVIPSDGFDEVWFAVNRENGRFIERMVLRMESSTCSGEQQISSYNQVFMDSVVTFNEPIAIEDITVDGDGNIFVTKTAHGFVTDDVITISCVTGMDEINNRKFGVLTSGSQEEILHLEMEGADEGTSFSDSSPYNHTVTRDVSTYGTVNTDTDEAAVGSASARFENINGNDASARVLLHFDNNVTDSSENGITVTNSGITFSNVGHKYGTHWAVFSSGNYLQMASSASWRWGTGDGALDCWITVDTAGNIIRHGKTDGTEIGWFVAADATHITFNYTTDGSTIITSTVKIPYTAGTRMHMAWNRYGNTFYGFKNGVLVGSEDWTGVSIYASFNVLRVGESFTSSFGGKIDELRIGIGARWYEDFPLRSNAYGPAQGLGFTENGAALQIPHHSAMNVTDEDFDLSFYYQPWDSMITTTVAEGAQLINKGSTDDTNISFSVDFAASGSNCLLRFRYSTTGSVGAITTYSHTILKAEFPDWSNTVRRKIHYSRRGTDLFLYIDDVLEETFNIGTNAIASTTKDVRIGARWVNAQSALHQGPSGWIDEVVWTKGSVDPDTFQLVDLGGDPINGTGYSEYISGGQIREAFEGFTGLDHLEGQTVSILGDGEVLEQQIVSGGEISINNSSAYVHVGLPYESDFETLNIEVGLRDGTTQGRKIKISNVTFRLLNTRGGFIGPDEDRIYEAFTTDNLSGATAVEIAPAVGVGNNRLFNVDVRRPLGAGYEGGGRVFYRQSDPLPVTILAVIPEATIPSPTVK